MKLISNLFGAQMHSSLRLTVLTTRSSQAASNRLMVIGRWPEYLISRLLVACSSTVLRYPKLIQQSVMQARASAISDSSSYLGPELHDRRLYILH